MTLRGFIRTKYHLKMISARHIHFAGKLGSTGPATPQATAPSTAEIPLGIYPFCLLHEKWYLLQKNNGFAKNISLKSRSHQSAPLKNGRFSTFAQDRIFIFIEQ